MIFYTICLHDASAGASTPWGEWRRNLHDSHFRGN